MIQLLSRLEVADNTGAKKVRMIRRIGQNKKTASVGDIIVCHVKESTTEASVKKRYSCKSRCRPYEISSTSS